MEELKKYKHIEDVITRQMEILFAQQFQKMMEFTDVSVLPGPKYIYKGEEITNKEYIKLFEKWQTSQCVQE